MTQDVLKYLQPNAAVPIDIETTSLLVNALRQAIKELESQKPVAWYYPGGSPDQCTTDKAYAEMEPAWTPLYTYPPQRTWVDLTPKDLNEIFEFAMTGEGAVHRAIAKLKQKNGFAEEKNT